MDFIEQVFLVDLWTFHRLGYSFKKAPRHGEEPDTSFPLCASVVRVLLNWRSPLFQLSTFTDTVVRLSLFAALISRMPSR